ncbi:PREDICTED: uncharacterized protein LOC106923615 [Poecilia mexicana]|uniref:uncharacterized protein LOC106923615 n=1 Tax=Poecilia mexicana TaxID=48701 RepID=UPI00072ED1E0|nr:PREDICTED: uncharacterized protein LOC106923615 [Poecilia mexicana]
MDTDQPENHQINDANCPLGTNTGDGLLITSEKGSQEKRVCGLTFGNREEGKCRPEEIKEEDKGGNRSVVREQKEKVVEVLKELNEFHAEILTDWRKVIHECVGILEKFPQGGDEHHAASTKDVSEYKTTSCSEFDGILSVGEDMEDLLDRVTKIIPKLDAAVLRLSTHEESAAAFQEPRDEDVPDQTEDVMKQRSEYNLELREEVQDAQNEENTLDSGFNSSNCSTEKENEEKTSVGGQEKDFYNQAPSVEAEEKDRENKTEDRTEEKWITTW